MQIMRVVDEKGDRSLPLFDKVSQRAFPSFGLSWDLKLLLGCQIVEQRHDQSGETNLALFQRERLGCQDFLVLGKRLLNASQHSRLATTDDARQGDEFSRFDFEFQFADDLLGMFRLKIPRLPEVPSKAVVISDVTQHGDSLSVRRPKYSSPGSMTSFLLSVVSTRVLIHSSCSGGSLVPLSGPSRSKFARKDILSMPVRLTTPILMKYNFNPLSYESLRKWEQLMPIPERRK